MKIIILPVGSIDQGCMQAIADGLARVLRFETRIAEGIPVPEECYDLQRRQYNSERVLGRIKGIKRSESEMILGVVDRDIYVPELNFIFGQAEISSGAMLISLARLREEFYGRVSDEELLKGRAAKEATHETGHACGLPHCRNSGCIMHFSNSIKDTDRKGPAFCRSCRERFGL